MNKLKFFYFLFLICCLVSCSEKEGDNIGGNDNCRTPYSLETQISGNDVFFQWQYTGSPGFFTVEYGPLGFSVGSGIRQNSTNQTNNLRLSGIDKGQYDFYVQSVCGGGEVSDWGGPQSFIVTAENCADPFNLNAIVRNYRLTLAWATIENANSYNIEYGEVGFTKGTGINATVNNDNSYSPTNFSYNKDYSFYVQSVCDNALSEWVGPKDFYTICNAPTGLKVTNATPNSISYAWDDDLSDSWLV